MIHYKCRGPTYVRDESIKRQQLTDDQVKWSTPLPDYKPVDHTAPSVLKQPIWADYPEDVIVQDGKKPHWNAVDGNVDRRSHMGEYKIDDQGLPINPVGRTGLRGRGCLGRWGPNHAADPIVTRWKMTGNDQVKFPPDNKPVLQFVAIQRRDTGEWAIPGGMVDPGEKVTLTLKREFTEEALNGLEMGLTEKERIKGKLDELFAHGQEIYRGYVDDPRNTDNAWMETIAYNFHDGHGDSVGHLKLHAGDDAVGVRWADIGSNLKLYASHKDMIEKVASLHDAHW